ncbi:hypothetical protein ACD661_03795 [Legionella lytica]|uniref:Uncharacterized protein n=1 Tax=Legionella lytica TaxID=96232 RepID=A0ABW8D4Q2_9GAMM
MKLFIGFLGAVRLRVGWAVKPSIGISDMFAELNYSAMLPLGERLHKTQLATDMLP